MTKMSMKMKMGLGVALVVVLAAYLQGTHAMVCESLDDDQVLCNKTTTSSGKCGWVEGHCGVVEALPEGMMGITAVNDEEGEENMPKANEELDGSGAFAAFPGGVLTLLVGVMLLLSLCT
mmetsp:Transcript_4260/g.11018  ORF Transcript_4260/g.11018 Transcript_4260/m.11018 type:complete len:120 (-) Transcript_4260:1054-1413(-)